MDLTLYWFMFPVGIVVATSAMLSGIGGAALFMPLFLLIFPLLGPAYPLDPIAAIGIALLIETFGFSSGFVGYYVKRLIDLKLASTFVLMSVPAAVAGALTATMVDPDLIRFAYGVLVLILAGVLFRGHEVPTEEMYDEDMYVDERGYTGSEIYDNPTSTGIERQIRARDGNVYRYNRYRARLGPTGLGGFLTGMLSVGIGEVVMPQLVKGGKVPVPVAAGTSIVVVIITVFSASFTHIMTLVTEGGLNAVPWHLALYTIPGVIIGGQIGPRLHGRAPSHVMERVIGGLFTVIGIAMLWTVLKDVF